MRPAQTVICTVGTSLFRPNLAGLRADDPEPNRQALARAYAAGDWEAVAAGLGTHGPTDRLCGAEINSLASLVAKGYAAADANLVFCHSDTADGQAIGRILEVYFRRAGHSSVQARTITDLQDRDARLFRTRGLRNLAKEVCKVIRDYGAASCAINATGGYKAQIAVAVLMGQSLGVPVYYKHELFDEIISFPPMPVALDFEAWMRLSGLLFALQAALQPADLVEDYPGDAETLESLVDRETVDGVDYLELSPTGQIFHETFRERFRTTRDQVLPPAVPTGQKKPPHVEDSGHMHAVRGLKAFLEAVTASAPQVVRCSTFWSHPDLPRPARFWVGAEGVEGQFSDGKALVKFRVETRATTPGQMAAVAATLNEWLQER
ncbi:MAG: putative CRISPR-associated protein [Isosphaeraceae bacterium]|jgi:putative CRISPR-associated protein (TIGR02619 family)